jgi:alpha-ketoglutarate-dependent taurine dioxygenase
MNMNQALADEISRTNEVELSLEAGIPVLTPRARSDFGCLAEFATQHRTRILGLVRWSGAVMLRGFEVATGDQYTRLMSGCLGTEAVTNKVLTTVFAWAKRKRRGEGVYDLPPADLQMQGPHIEVGWRSRRPRYISLWCEVPPVKAGETALFDMAAAYDHLDDELRGYFDRYASEYRRSGRSSSRTRCWSTRRPGAAVWSCGTINLRLRITLSSRTARPTIIDGIRSRRPCRSWPSTLSCHTRSATARSASSCPRSSRSG